MVEIFLLFLCYIGCWFSSFEFIVIVCSEKERRCWSELFFFVLIKIEILRLLNIYV